jgi:hypothetical protein
VIIFVGCDPGWQYNITDEENQTREIQSSGTVVKVICSKLFSVPLDIEVAIINIGEDTIEG